MAGDGGNNDSNGNGSTTAKAAPADYDAIRDMTRDADCIVFDCDGVLVDVSGSYHRAIQQTVEYMTGRIASELAIPDMPARHAVSRHTVERFKNTGLFNDETDVSCAITLAAVMPHLAGGCTYESAIDTAVRNSGPDGIASVIRHMRDGAEMSRAVELLDHPSPDRGGLLCRVFDEKFYGSDIYSGRGGRPLLGNEIGHIRCDDVIVTDAVMEALSGRFGKSISMVTGRGLQAARYTLEPVMGWFDLGNSAFLEDEPREHAKPNPDRLDDCIRGMGCKRAIYVGDSAEDAAMARDAESDVAFCGITGTGVNPDERRRILERAAGTGIPYFTLGSVLDIPKALNLEGQIHV
ncbi:MAG: HAD family hydrolase [Thaumarchaeota archaeon]|nr:HAD family hydrolase [Nitrososphaerota archaeon]MDE0266768.1 HAD family hydrolase [Nitrososphaerota archaeon]MDE0525589.1 HAD family hydrolase [Nitrososphaerota archaeon]